VKSLRGGGTVVDRVIGKGKDSRRGTTQGTGLKKKKKKN